MAVAGFALIALSPAIAAGATTFEMRASASWDDAVEATDGSVSLNGGMLTLGDASGGFVAGIRWSGLAIPAGSTITAAWVEFRSWDTQSGLASLTLRAQAADSPPAFSSTRQDVSTRPLSAAVASWSPSVWNAGSSQRTCDLRAVVQEVVNRPGWTSGNALVMILNGTGRRDAWAVDAGPVGAPLIHIEYVSPTGGSTGRDPTSASASILRTGSGEGAPLESADSTSVAPPSNSPPVAGLTVTQLASPALTVSADASTSTDTDAFPIATYHFDFGDGSPVVDVSAPVTIAQHTYAAPGSYTVTLTATDTGDLTSVPATSPITVEPPPDSPPVAGLEVTQLPAPAFTVRADAGTSTDTDATPIATYHFDFGDGSPVVDVSAPADTVRHTYAAAGNYTVTLTATDTGNLTSAPVTGPIAVDAAPVASVTLSQVASPALTVRADASGSTDTDAFPIATYHFDFGDGSPGVDVAAPADTARHTYAAPGSYTVTLTATDTGHLTSAPATGPIAVDAAPVAQVAVSQLASPALTVRADASGSIDTDAFPIATYHFDFGDGSPVVDVAAPADTARHSYAAAGSYTVTLTATDTGNLTSAPVTGAISVDAAPVAHVTVAQITSPALTVRADASASTDTDAFPIATYHFDFGDGSPVVDVAAPADTALHTYAASGSYNVTLTATDTGNLTSAPVTRPITVDPAPVLVTLERRIATSTDDAEEFADSTMYLNSSDLELIHDSSDQTVGMRWTGLTIPPHSTITAAWIQFSAKESQSVATSLSLHAQAADAPPTFSSTRANVSSRPLTTAAVSWAPVAWNAGEAGANQRTPDLSGPIQEVVSRPGWASGNPLVVIVSGTGHRTAWAYDGNAAAAPLLHVEYLTTPLPEMPPVARLSVNQLAAPPLTVRADASASTDMDTTPIATYHFDFGDGSPVVTVAAPTVTAQHTYADTGTYTVTLTATDTGNSTSAPTTAPITVVPSATARIAVYVGYYDTHHLVNPKPKPDPWKGSPGVVFIGVADDSQNNWDSCGLRVDNLTGGPLSGVVVTADLGSHHYALWGTNTIPAGTKLILAQTATQNFDGSDTNPAGCYGCDPAQCLTLRSSDIPVVHVSIGGPAADYFDTNQVLNTGGYDGAGCPYLGGPLPQTRYDESHPWEQIYSSSPLVVASALNNTAGASTQAEENPVPRTLSLAAPSPNPSRGDVALRFTLPVSTEAWIGIYDLSGRLVRTCLDNALHAGEYTFHPDLSNVRPGVYFVRLWTPRGSLRERLVVTR